jgi:hypothetical protein
VQGFGRGQRATRERRKYVSHGEYENLMASCAPGHDPARLTEQLRAPTHIDSRIDLEILSSQ